MAAQRPELHVAPVDTEIESAADETDRERPILQEAALHGLAGDFVRLVAPQSEADQASLLFQFLVSAGSLIGRGPCAMAEDTPHYTNEFALIVGETAKARKGTALKHVRRVCEEADREWARDCQAGGLSSGEGLISEVDDSHGENGGVRDKRRLIVETEFATVLKAMNRDANPLSGVLRQAWDGDVLHQMTKNNPLRATDAHISLIAHITMEELRRELTATEKANGLANRHLFAYSRRSQLRPRGGMIPSDSVKALAGQLATAKDFAKGIADPMECDGEAEALWCESYAELSASRPGMLGAVTARMEAHALRLYVLYALLDCSPVVRVEHVQAALAVCRYSVDSAAHIFGDALGDPDADLILDALRRSPAGLARTLISGLFARNAPAERITRALRLLERNGLANMTMQRTDGRSSEVWRAMRRNTK